MFPNLQFVSLEIHHAGFWNIFSFRLLLFCFFTDYDHCFHSLVVFSRIHSSIHLCNVSCATDCNIIPKHDIQPPCLTVGKVFFLWNYSLFFSPNMPLLIMAKEIYFNFISPQHSINAMFAQVFQRVRVFKSFEIAIGCHFLITSQVFIQSSLICIIQNQN